MADQAERVILEAEDQVSPVVDKANAGLDSFEKKAESSHGKVIRISDQTRTSVQRLIASLEKQAETYGKSGVDRLITQRDQLLQRYNREPQAIDAITKSYEKMIAMEEKAARESLALKAAKEAEEALLKQSEAIKGFGERVSQFMENPLQGAKGAVSSVLTALGPFGIAVATGQWFGYSLIPLSMEILSIVTLIHVIGSLGHYLTIRGFSPVYTEDFCDKRRKPGLESLVAVKPTRS